MLVYYLIFPTILYLFNSVLLRVKCRGKNLVALCILIQFLPYSNISGFFFINFVVILRYTIGIAYFVSFILLVGSYGPSKTVLGHNGRRRSVHFGGLWTVRWVPLPWHQHRDHHTNTICWMAGSCHVDPGLCGWNCTVDIAFVAARRQHCHTRKCNLHLSTNFNEATSGKFNFEINFSRHPDRIIAIISWALCPALCQAVNP